MCVCKSNKDNNLEDSYVAFTLIFEIHSGQYDATLHISNCVWRRTDFRGLYYGIPNNRGWSKKTKGKTA